MDLGPALETFWKQRRDCEDASRDWDVKIFAVCSGWGSSAPLGVWRL
jgi:hypothetical protein